jgi:hypothetical protein
MHEIELGVWRSLFLHLLRILESMDGLIHKLDWRFVWFTLHLHFLMIALSRYRQISTFGRDSIRRFSNNVSGLKRLGARDYENLLQVSIFAYIIGE